MLSINTFLKNKLAVTTRFISYNHDRYSYSIKENPDKRYMQAPKNYKIPSYLSPEEIEATKTCQFPNTDKLFQKFLHPTGVEQIPLKYKFLSTLGFSSFWVATRLLLKPFIKIYHRGEWEKFNDYVMTDHKKRTHQMMIFSNHTSTLDDPMLNIINFPWFPVYSNGTTRLPWNIVGHNVLFTTKFKNWWFTYGRAVPVIRGKGIDQQGIHFLEERQKHEPGFFMNVYCEGKVNMFYEKLDLKWGGAKFILNSIERSMETAENSFKIPMQTRILYHFGCDRVLSPFRRPNPPLYFPDFTRLHPVLIAIGKPLDFSLLIKTMRKRREKSSLIDFQGRSTRAKALKMYTDLQACEERETIMNLVELEMQALRRQYLPEYDQLCENHINDAFPKVEKFLKFVKLIK